MESLAKLLVFFGIGIALFGVVLLYRDRLPFLKTLGHLPGDLNFRFDNVSVHIPIVTCIVISLILSLILRLFRGS